MKLQSAPADNIRIEHFENSYLLNDTDSKELQRYLNPFRWIRTVHTCKCAPDYYIVLDNACIGVLLEDQALELDGAYYHIGKKYFEEITKGTM